MNVPKEVFQRLEAQAPPPSMDRSGPVIICPQYHIQRHGRVGVPLQAVESGVDTAREGTRLAEFMFQNACGSFMDAFFDTYRRLTPKRWER